MIKSFFISLLILTLFYPQESKAQGIEGGKIALNYNFQISPDFNREHETFYKEIEQGILHPKHQHLLELNFIVSKTLMIGPDVHMFNLNILNPENDPVMSFKNRGWGIHIQKFFFWKGSIAPMGTWAKVRFYRNKGLGTLLSDNSDIGGFEQWDFSITLGKQSILAKHFLINAGIGVNINNFRLAYSSEDSFIAQNNYLDEIYTALNERQILFINIGVGWNGGLK